VKGAEVLIVLERDQLTGKPTRGIVKNISTRSESHPHGIKVRLTDGRIGQVQEIISLPTAKSETKKMAEENFLN